MTLPPGARRLHPDVVKLGVVSLLTDLSSEMIFSVFAIFFTTVAGASTALLGLIEGLADFAASALTYLAGWMSDRGGRRKPYAVAGYAFSTMAKLILLLSSSIVGLSLFRVLERLGKGMRGPPRDAWLAAITAGTTRGYAFGVHKALDKTGAVLGPLAAYGLLSWLGESAHGYRVLFVVAMLPAVLSVLFLARIPDQAAVPHARESVLASWDLLGPGFKVFLLPSGVFALAYFSLGFILLKAHAVGFSATHIVLLYALFNTSCVLAAPLAGRLGDQLGRGRVVLLGYALYAGLNLWLVVAETRQELVAVFVLYGLFYAVEDSQSKAFIADLEPKRRATAMGLYQFATGLLYLPASLLAGALWSVAPALAFAVAAALSGVAAVVFVILRPAMRRG